MKATVNFWVNDWSILTVRPVEAKYTAKWTIWQVKLMGWGGYNIRFRKSLKKSIFLTGTFTNGKKLWTIGWKLTKYLISKYFNGFSCDFVLVICLHCTSAGWCDALSDGCFTCQIVHFAVYFTSFGLAVTIQLTCITFKFRNSQIIKSFYCSTLQVRKILKYNYIVWNCIV